MKKTRFELEEERLVEIDAKNLFESRNSLDNRRMMFTFPYSDKEPAQIFYETYFRLKDKQ